MKPLHRSLTAPLSAALVLAALSGEAAAQDAHYWSLQYGNRARLLGGAVIGSVLDISAVYYNPGALSLLSEQGLLLAGNVFQYSVLKWNDALGENRDLSSTKFEGVPSLFAGELRFGFLGDSRVAYSFLTRQRFDTRLTATGVISDPFPDVPNLGTLAANVRIEQNMSEYWAGLTWARTLGARLGLGATMFVAIRNQRTSFATTAEVVGTDTDEAGVALSARAFDYQHWRLLWKIGLAAEFERLELGLTVTTPSLALWGSGSSGFNRAVIVQNIDTADPTLPLVEVDFQDGVSADYQSALSVGAGAAYQLGASKLYASAEWFDKVDEFEVLDTQPFVGQTTGDSVSFDVTAELDDVLNFGAGVEHQFNQKTGGYASFRTDFSAAVPQSQTNSAITFWDLYHVALGATFTVMRSVWTLGGVFAFGGEDIAGIDLLPGEEENDQIGIPDETRLNYSRFTFILGFELAFQ